jgi:GNAT superfamily N-acetyltransferase
MKPKAKKTSTVAARGKAEGTKRGKGTVVVRNWTHDDLAGIVEAQQATYPDYLSTGGLHDERHYEMQLQAFPEGQFLAEIDGEIVGFATALIVQIDDLPDDYRYNEITGSGTFSTHTPGGDTLYGADIGVRPTHRGRGIAKKLYTARKKLMERYNLRRMVAYGRIPGYRDHAGKYSPAEYVELVKRGELKDSALNAHLSAGYEVVRLLNQDGVVEQLEHARRAMPRRLGTKLPALRKNRDFLGSAGGRAAALFWPR